MNAGHECALPLRGALAAMKRKAAKLMEMRADTMILLHEGRFTTRTNHPPHLELAVVAF